MLRILLWRERQVADERTGTRPPRTRRGPRAGYLVATSELVFGALLVLGLLTRLSTIPLGVILGVAVIGVKLGEVGLIAGMDAMLTGYELDLAPLAGLVALLFLGGGRLSLDRALGLDRGSGPVRSAGASV